MGVLDEYELSFVNQAIQTGFKSGSEPKGIFSKKRKN
jgi:hypothetical protein